MNAWLAAGRPPGTATLGKFEAWVAAVGGILKATGIDGLLDNAEAFRRAATSQASEMPEFIAKWHERFATVRVTSAELFDCAEGVLTLVLNAKDVQGRKTQLGKFLHAARQGVRGMEDKVLSDHGRERGQRPLRATTVLPGEGEREPEGRS